MHKLIPIKEEFEVEHEGIKIGVRINHKNQTLDFSNLTPCYSVKEWEDMSECLNVSIKDAKSRLI